MVDIYNKKALELYFADNFETALFPVLADYYLQEKDYERAEKVCEIGLEHHPDSVDGLFMSAQVAVAQGRDQDAEQYLKKILSTGVIHYESLRLLAGIQKHLQRSINTQAATWKKIQQVNPASKSARSFFKAMNSKDVKPEKTDIKVKKAVPKKSAPQNEPQVLVPLSDRLITFTMVAVLNDQGLYHQALDMLDILEQKGKDPVRIKKERKKIDEYLKGLNEES